MSLSRELIVAAKARADAATEGPWEAEGSLIEGRERVVAGTYIQSAAGTDAEFIAASREDVPVMADALLRVLDLHRRAHAVFSWNSGRRYEEPCPECDGKAGVHPCGCWADSDIQYVCQGCSEVDNGHVLYPCPTVRAITGPESGGSE